MSNRGKWGNMEQFSISLPVGWKDKMKMLAIEHSYKIKEPYTYLDLIRDGLGDYYNLKEDSNSNKDESNNK